MANKIFCIIYFLFHCFHLPAQKTLDNFIVYSGQKLPSNVNFRIFEDSRGYLWIGSKNGLFQFDGLNFKPYYSFYDDSTTLTSNATIDIEEDSNGFLWISTLSNGLVRYNPYTGKMKQYPLLTPSNNPVYPVLDIFKDADNTLWFGTGGRGIARYDAKKDSFYNYIVDSGKKSDGSVRFENEITKITADPDYKNILWAAGMEGLFRFNKTTGAVEIFEFRINNKIAWRDNSFLCIYIEDLQNIWLGTWAGGLVKFNYHTRQFTHYLIDEKNYLHNGFSKNIIHDILPGPGKQLFICSADAGFIAFDKVANKFSQLIDIKKLPNGEVYTNSAFRSKNGSLWIAADGYILQYHSLFNRFQQTFNLSSFAEKGLLAPAFTDAVFDESRRKYFVSLNGNPDLLALNEDLSFSHRVPCTVKDPIRNISNIFFDHKGRLLASSSSPPYLLYLDKTGTILRPVNGELIPKKRLPDSMNIRNAIIDRENNIWLASNRNQLIKWDTDKNNTTIYPLAVSKQSGLPATIFIIEMATDYFMNIWLATNVGLVKFDAADEKFTHYYSNGNAGSSIASNYLNAVAVDRQNKIWIAPQYQGLQVFDPILEKVIENYSEGRNGLANHIDDIDIDNKDNIWFTSNNGLLKFNTHSGLWKAFNSGDGLSRTNIVGSLAFTENNKMLLSLPPGVVMFNPNKMPENDHLPIMHITGFDVMGKPFLTDSLPEYKKNIRLAYNQNRVEITVTAIETVYPDKLKSYYRLIGLDTTWNFSESRHISFVNLAAGKYRFEVKAFNSDGYESKHPAVISFTVEKPFWQTIWFISLCAIIFATLLYAVYKYRIGQILKVQAVKNKISADLHDDIGSRLTHIQLLTLISKKKSVLDTETIKILGNIQDEISASSEALHVIVTNMRVKDDENEDLTVKLRRYAAQVFELANLKLKIEIDDAISGLKLNPEKRNDIFLIFRELINNTNKHAAAQNISIAVRKEKNTIRINITDDGIGFDTTTLSSRNGLKILKGRVEKWKGEITTTSSAGKGTMVQIVIPV